MLRLGRVGPFALSVALGAALVAGALAVHADEKKADEKPPEKAPSPEESPNLKLPANLSNDSRAKLEEAIAAWKAAEAKFRAEGYQAAKADMDAVAAKLRSRRQEDLSNPLPLYYLGILYQLETDDQHAVENLSACVKLNPKFHEAWTELGDAHAHLGAIKDAEAAYAKALALSPSYAPAIRGRAWLKLETGRYEDARTDVKQGLELLPKDFFLSVLEKKLKLAIEGPAWTVKFEKVTENFIIKTNVDQPFADWLGKQAELIRKLYVKLFEKTRLELPKRKYTVIVFSNAKEYHDFGGPAMAGGHYDPEVRQLFLFKYPKNEDGQMVLFHEGFHQFLHPYLPRAPQWFNEGLGDYFGGAKYVTVPEEGIKIVPNWWRLPTVKGLINNKQDRPWRELMLMSRAQLYDPKTAGQNYAQAWSIIYFLCEYQGRKYFPLLGRYFNAIRAGKDQEQAFKAAFGDQDVKKIEEEWRAFVLSLN